jgi:hypothetical protein
MQAYSDQSRESKCTCSVGPGKFEGEPAETFMAYEQAMLGNTDASTGESDMPGSMTDWLRSPLNLDADSDVVRAAIAYGYCPTCVEAAGKDIAGGIAIYENEQGFVYGTSYATREEFDAALAAAEVEDEAEALADAREGRE